MGEERKAEKKTNQKTIYFFIGETRIKFNVDTTSEKDF